MIVQYQFVFNIYWDFVYLKNYSNHVFFWHIGIQDVDISIPYEANTICETWKLHSIKTIVYQYVFAFDRRKELCFCSICMEGTQSIEICENETCNYVKS